jgi:elongator complex protein 5
MLTILLLGFLVILDSLTTLASLSTDPAYNLNLTAFLSSLLQPVAAQPGRADQEQPPQVSLVAVYHADVPLPPPPSSPGTPQGYSPSPLSLLSYLATTVITVHSLAILLAEKVARAKSLASPSFGLSGEIEGVVVGLKPKPVADMNPGEEGIVLELEHRRKSGRGVREWFFLPTAANAGRTGGIHAFRETVILLDDHPRFRRPKDEAADGDQELSGMTFELGLTERQRLEREGVVLPYFDAQKAGGGGEGGRILYDMGVEDDFDEEEDEI